MPKDTTKIDNQLIEVDPNALLKELERIHNKKQSSSEASSALGHLRKTSAEQLGCHKDALSMIERIDGMSEDKLMDFMRSFQPMYQAMWAAKWSNVLGDMVDQMEAESEDMDSDMDE